MIEVIGDKIIARRLNLPRRYGSIFAPDQAVRLSQEYIVEYAGKGEYDKRGRLQPLDVKAGDRVLIGKHDAKAIELNGEEKWTCREQDIIAVIEL